MKEGVVNRHSKTATARDGKATVIVVLLKHLSLHFFMASLMVGRILSNKEL